MGKIKITLIYGGQRFKINIDTDLSVYQSKREFETYISVAASHQCLQYFGQVLEDDQVISDVINPKRATIVCQNTSIAPTNARASKSASKKPKNVQVSIHYPSDFTSAPKSIKIDPRMLVWDLISTVKDAEQVHHKHLRAELDGKPLCNGRRFSFYKEIWSASPAALSIAYSGPALEAGEYPSITVFVKTLAGKTITLNGINIGMEVSMFKEAIADKEGSPPSTQRLIFGGKQLEDNLRLHQYGVSNQSTLHLVLRLKGGNLTGHAMTD